MTISVSAKRRTRRAQWWIVAGLVLLSAVPALAGSLRLAELAGGAEVTEDNARFFAAPAPVVVHIIGAVLFCVLGAFQFVDRLRVHRWHRWSGQLLVPCGLLAAGSALWMTLFYPKPELVGSLLTAFRLVFASAMAVAIVLAVIAVRRRDIRRHRAWMIRGYAIAQGAGTQALILGPWQLIAGTPDELTFALLMAASWLINIAVGEWAIRR